MYIHVYSGISFKSLKSILKCLNQFCVIYFYIYVGDTIMDENEQGLLENITKSLILLVVSLFLLYFITMC